MGNYFFIGKKVNIWKTRKPCFRYIVKVRVEENQNKTSFVPFFESWLIRCFALHSVACCTLQTLTNTSCRKLSLLNLRTIIRTLFHTRNSIFLYLYSKDKSNCVQYLTCSLQKSYCSHPPPPSNNNCLI